MISLGEISGILTIGAVVPYLYEVFKKGVRPERASWFIWTVLLLISLVAQRRIGAHDSLWLTAGDVIGTSIVFFVSIFRGVGGFTKFDITCLAIAILGVYIWQLSGNPLAALFGSLLADAMGSLPTLRKAYLTPADEGWTTFLIIGTTSILAIIAAHTSNLYILAFPVYLVAINYAVLIARYRGFKHMKQHELA